LKGLQDYIVDEIGLPFRAERLQEDQLSGLPLFLLGVFTFYHAVLDGHDCTVLYMKEGQLPRVDALIQQVGRIQDKLGHKVIVWMNDASAYQRKKLVERRLNFVVPYQQLYLPDFYIDVRPSVRESPRADILQPLAQQILIAHLLDRTWHGSRLENAMFDIGPFQKLAADLGTNAMAITRAATNLKDLKICDVMGTKRKFIRFTKGRNELWNELNDRKLWINPVLKSLYVDTRPEGRTVRQGGETGLSLYTDLNPPQVPILAMDKSEYYHQRQYEHWNESQPEGNFLLQVWHYNPAHWQNNEQAVDPISLYLTLKDTRDERLEMELSKLLNEKLWWLE